MPVKVLDSSPVEEAFGLGWRRKMRRVLTECETCGTVSSRIRQEEEFDEGTHPKRSLRGGR
jgi:hypothetical protein